ncbi:MAG: alpha-xylosidase [Clostridia bacterium]|nr:alpha-xylosidase [Clostridia bacterium]
MLDKHLRAETRPVANEKNLVFWKDYRVTVLFDRLFRVERSAEGRFTDEATQAVWFRDMPENKFTVTAAEDALTVDTGAVKLVLKEKFEQSYAVLGGSECKLSNAGNLLGTYRTLDGFDGDMYMYHGTPEKITLGTGVCSKTGVAIVDDGKSLLLDKNGEIRAREENAFDLYVFAYGKDFRAALRAFFAVEGDTPMIPRYALGNWWSRYYVYTDRSYLQLLNKFEEHNVPLSVATIDMDWHYSVHIDEEKQISALGRNTEFYGGNSGWTGYSWNKNLFPDYKGFLKKIQEKNLKITLNLHPADGVRWFEDSYNEMAKALGRDASTLEKIPFDVTSPEFMNQYFKILHKPYEGDGVEFWWIDWQQGEASGMKGLDPLWALNHYHYLDSAVNHDHGLVLSRYCGAGAHRYPLGFTGDTYISWNTLDYLPYFTLTASNVGYCWWSHDIGGHMQGVQDGELYVRSLQFGVFNPVNRLHSTCNQAVTKEPWYYPNGCGEIAMRYLRFRHKLVPYLYSAAYRTHTEGRALVEPMYYEYPDEEEAYRVKNQYLFGDQLMVAPVTKKGGAGGYAKKDVWFPKGVWTDIFTGERYEGGKTVTVRRTLENIPVFARAGAVLPLDEELAGNGCPLPRTLRVKAFCGNGMFELYEDSGKKCAVTTFVNAGKKGEQALKIGIAGDAGVIPADRKLIVEFADAPYGAVSVTASGAPAAFRETVADRPTVVLEGLKAGTEYCVTLTYQEPTRLERIKENALHVLLQAEGSNADKETLHGKLAAVRSETAFVETVQKSELPQIVKDKLLETL